MRSNSSASVPRYLGCDGEYSSELSVLLSEAYASLSAASGSSENELKSSCTMPLKPPFTNRLLLPLYMAITVSYFGNTSTYWPNAPLN